MRNFIFGIITTVFISGIIHASMEQTNIPRTSSNQQTYSELKAEVDKAEKELNRNHELNKAINECEAEERDCSVEYANKALSDYNHDHNLMQ